MNSMIKSMMKIKELKEILEKYEDEDDVELIVQATDEADALLAIKGKEWQIKGNYKNLIMPGMILH